MVKKLASTEDSEQQQSSQSAKKLVKKIKSDFEENMNDDLQIKAAFDSLYKTVTRLVKLKEKQKLSADDSKDAVAELKAIDYVLQAIF